MVSLDYLAGLYDGEGTICAVVTENPQSPNGETYHTKVRVFNTNKDIILQSQKVLKENNIKSNIYVLPRKNNDVYSLSITNQKNQLKFCELMEDKLIMKGKQCKLLKEYLISRLSRPRLYSSYTDKESGIVYAMRELNGLNRYENINLE